MTSNTEMGNCAARLWWLGCLALIVSVGGCGEGRPQRVPVSGQVLIDGKPLTVGYIRFVPEGARPSGGQLDSQGRFTLTCYDGQDGAVPGKHRVEVAATEQVDETAVRWHAPKRYANFAESGLEVTITEPTDSLTIELTWDGGQPFVERHGVE